MRPKDGPCDAVCRVIRFRWRSTMVMKGSSRGVRTPRLGYQAQQIQNCSWALIQMRRIPRAERDPCCGLQLFRNAVDFSGQKICRNANANIILGPDSYCFPVASGKDREPGRTPAKQP